MVGKGDISGALYLSAMDYYLFFSRETVDLAMSTEDNPETQNCLWISFSGFAKMKLRTRSSAAAPGLLRRLRKGTN